MTEKMGYCELPLADVVPSPDNPRMPCKDKAFIDLVASIKTIGVLEPVLVRPHPKQEGKFDLRAGFRRLTAAGYAGLERIPAIVRDLSDEEAFGVTVVENLHREDLHPLEEACGLAKMREHGWDAETIAVQLGKSPGWVARRAQLTHLTESWQEAVENPKSGISQWPARSLELIARMEPHVQEELFERFHRSRWIMSHREIADVVDDYLRKLPGARWKLDDADLVPEAGACASCIKRTDRQLLLFEDLEPAKDKNARCLDAKCWAQKVPAYLVQKAAELRDKHGHKLVLIKNAWEESPVAGPTVSHYDATRCKKSVKGARPALVVSGPDAGATQWVKLRAGATAVAAKAAGPKTLAERREALEARRAAHLLTALREMLTEPAPLVDARTEAVVALAAVFGTAREYRAEWYDGETVGRWESMEKLTSAPSLAVEVCWKRVAPVLMGLLNYGQVGDAPERLQDAKGICILIDADYDALRAAAEVALPEPKGWAKLNANGTPKSAAPRRKPPVRKKPKPARRGKKGKQ